ncbi:protein NODULATION SIGNALING PATHWAY 2-like [Tripterygium wilfordii]|uniref:protein NODULATION SIGNALING PATHWAY 2-like n=1 Tax=Tripterygium wilfordii TaxID=458696 RepID=UPI0018F83D94|nr:protein NODULATION SIGNALING PATHWAY 2-like [Tripterygium wilfordii]
MAMAIDETCGLQFSGHTTTIPTSSTETDYDIHRNWNNWPPVLDWENLSCDHHNDFNMIDHGGFMNLESQETCDSVSTDTMFLDDEDTKGLRLVHLLMAAAEALTGVNESHELARVILVRLKELVSPNDGSNMERLAAYFTDALQGLLEGAHGKHSISNGTYNNHQTDMIAAFQLLQDMSPCIKFGHFTANQAIMESVAQDRRVHIVDYDIMEGIQWASFMQGFVSRKDGPPGPHLRITAITRTGNGRRSMGTVQETGRRLISFAASIGLSFSFHQCRLNSDETFLPSALKLIKGEALIINCMLHLPHSNYQVPDSIISFLSGAKTLSPRLVTLVEEVAGSIGDGGFLGRFMDSLHHYSALYDSLEDGFPMQARARALVEKVFLGPRIARSLARIYRTRGEDEGCSWWERLGNVGFNPVNISFANGCQAKLLLGLFNDGYKVEELGNGRLVLGWKSRQLLSASIWTSRSEPKL